MVVRARVVVYGNHCNFVKCYLTKIVFKNRVRVIMTVILLHVF